MKGRNARLCKLPQLKAEHGYNVCTFKIQIGGYLVAFLWVKRSFEVPKMKKGCKSVKITINFEGDHFSRKKAYG